MIVDPGDMELDPASERIVEEADAQTKKKIEVLHGYAASEPHGHERRIVLRFFASPLEIVGAERVEGVRVGRTELVEDGDGRLRAVVTEAEETIPCQLVFRSVGYRGMPLPGVPFDERRATIPNDHGRVLDAPGGTQRPGEYVSGWIKRGPSGDHRHEQEGQPGHRRRAAGGPRRRQPPRARGRGSRRDPALLADRCPDHITLRPLAGDRRARAKPPASPTAARA